MKMFTRWLVRDGRTNDDRLVHLSKMNVEVDRRRIRRPRSMDEFGKNATGGEIGQADCAETFETRTTPRKLENAKKSPVKTGLLSLVLHRTASLCSEVPEAGLEPALPCGNWILNPAPDSRNDQRHKEIREIENAEVPVLVPSISSSAQNAALPPDLADVVAAWPDLPDAIKTGVVALVRAAVGKREADET
jgi:hypothetical protein